MNRLRIAHKPLNQIAIPLRCIAVGEFSLCECPFLSDGQLSEAGQSGQAKEADG